MFARPVSFQLKPNSAAETIQTLENEVLPLRRKPMKLRCTFLSLLVAILEFCWPAMAQVDTGVLSGNVYDAQQAPVPRAQVIVLNLGTNYKLDLETNTDGLYVSPPLAPGRYRNEVSVGGFQTAAKEIELHLSERPAVDFTLSVGGMTEKVTVTAVASVLQTETATLSTRRDDKELKEIPNLTRSFVELMRYSPGVVP